MSELFQPSTAQLSRLAEEEYERIAEITLRRLIELEQASDLPDPDDTQALIDTMLLAQQRLEREIEPIIEKTIEGDSTETFERDIAEAVTDALLLALLLGIGGTARLRQQRQARTVVNLAKQLINGQHRAISRNADKLSKGGFTTGQLRDIPRRRGLAVRSGYEMTRHAYNMVVMGHNEGMRFLNSPHPCPSCPQYERTNWVAIEEIVPPATLCLCQANCKCTTISRFNPERAIQELMGGSLSQQLQRSEQFLRRTEENFLKENGLS
ncbi:MAG: hypothetical protein AAF810_17330 [Cyanobacteria bacterium P01_D01_bin.36]